VSGVPGGGRGGGEVKVSGTVLDISECPITRLLPNQPMRRMYPLYFFPPAGSLSVQSRCTRPLRSSLPVPATHTHTASTCLSKDKTRLSLYHNTLPFTSAPLLPLDLAFRC
jgi:hypothetical protein